MTDDCRDVNECAINPNICKNGRCVNTKGSYKCQCYDGFIESKDGKQCLDRRKGYCFRQLINGMCTTSSDDLVKVKSVEPLFNYIMIYLYKRLGIKESGSDTVLRFLYEI